MRPERGNSTANRVVLQDPLEVALVRPEGLLRFGGWNRLPGDWRLNPLRCRPEYDAADLGTMLYSSDQLSSRDSLDFATKFSVPLVANGKVFVTTMGRLTIYGLLR